MTILPNPSTPLSTGWEKAIAMAHINDMVISTDTPNTSTPQTKRKKENKEHFLKRLRTLHD